MKLIHTAINTQLLIKITHVGLGFWLEKFIGAFDAFCTSWSLKSQQNDAEKKKKKQKGMKEKMSSRVYMPCFYFEACALIDNDEIAGIPDRLLLVLPLEIAPFHQYINHGLKLFSSFFFTVRIKGSSLICFTAWRCWRRWGSALCLEAALAKGMEPTTSGMKVSQFKNKSCTRKSCLPERFFFFFLS